MTPTLRFYYAIVAFITMVAVTASKPRTIFDTGATDGACQGVPQDASTQRQSLLQTWSKATIEQDSESSATAKLAKEHSGSNSGDSVIHMKQHKAKRMGASDEPLLSFCPWPNTPSFDKNEQVAAMLSEAKPGLLVDVGAWDGLDAIAYAQTGHSVISVEPIPSKFKTINDNIQASGLADRISFYGIALANFSGNTTFYYSDNGSEQDSMNRKPWSTNNVTVKVDTLDNIIGDQTVMFMKVDAQGFDPVVLKGGQKLLVDGRVQFLVFEVSPGLTTEWQEYPQIVKLLNSYGYSCFDCAGFTGVHGQQINSDNVDAFIQVLLTKKTLFKGAEHGQWTNLVCQAPKGRL